MYGFNTGLLLLVVALSWRNQVSLATPHIQDHGSYFDVTLERRNLSDRSSEGEDDDWEEHHEWTYTELNDDEESGEGHYNSAALSDPRNYKEEQASHYIGSAVGANTSSSDGNRANMNKEKSKQVFAPNQQTNIKNSQPQKETSYVIKTSTKAFASKAQKLTTTSTRATFVDVGNQHFNRPAKSLRTSPKTTVSLGSKGDEARDYKWSHQSGSKLTSVTALNSKKHHSEKEIPGEGSKEDRNNSNSTTTGINSASKRYATNNTERNKQSVTANGKSKVAGSFISKGNKSVKTYSKEVHHGRRKSSSSVNFAGSSNNGSIFASPSSNSIGRNRTGSFKVKRTAGKTSTKAVTLKRYRGKIENVSVRGATHAARKHLGSRFPVGSTSTLSDFQSSKTTLNNVYKRNHTASSKLAIAPASKNNDRKSMKKFVKEVSEPARENSGSQSIAGSAITEHGSRWKTSKSGNVLAHRPNANRRVVSSNYKSSDAKNKLNTVAKTTVSMSAAAANALLALKPTQAKASAQRGARQSTVSSSKGGSHVRSHAFGTLSGGYSSGVVDRNGSTSRRVGHNTRAGATRDIRGTRHRTYLAYNGSSWSGLGGARGDNRSKRSWNRYFVGSRKRRKKGRSVIRVRRIRRRRRKRRGRRKIDAQPQVEITRARDKEQASSGEKLVAGAQIRPIKTVPLGLSSPVKQALQSRQHNARSHAAELSAVASYVNRSRLRAHKLPKTTAPTALPLEPPKTRKPGGNVAERITTPRKRPKELETHRTQNENTYALRRKNLQTQEVHSHKATSAQRKRLRLQIPPDGSAPAMLPNRNKSKQSRDNEGPDLVRQHRKRHHANRLPRCRSSPPALTGETGNLVGGGLMWFPAASCVASGLDWSSAHSTACLHQQIAFVHRYKVFAPAFPSVNESYMPGFCGSYVPWRHVTPDHVTDLLYDGSIVSGLSLHRFGFINPGGYTFELLPHTGRFILVGVPFHRRVLSLCNLKPPTLGLLFTGTGLRDGSLGMHRFDQICSRLEDYVKTNPNNLYWGFPTVSVRTIPVAVRVPERSTDTTTPVLPIASESAEAFTQKVFTEPLALYPDAPVDYSEAHTDFLEPVVFFTNPIQHEDDAIDEDVIPPRYVEVAAPVIDGREAPVVEGAAQTVARTAMNDGFQTMTESQNSVEVIHPIVDDEQHSGGIDGPEMAVDGLSANVPNESVYDGVDDKADYIGYDAGLGFDDADPGYYEDVTEPIVHVTEQMLSFPAPSL